MNWNFKSFDELTAFELYEILKLREQVFTIGQQCTEPDIDDVDLKSLHVFAYDNGHLIAYLRIYDKNDVKNIGRVVVNPNIQGKGYGRELMRQAIAYLKKNHPMIPIHMSAQLYLKPFYQSLGFIASGETYLEAGIMHIFMFM